MTRVHISGARRAVAGLLVLASVSYGLAYLLVALARVNYPFELEWMEGGMLDHVRRVVAGDSIYAKPSLEFVSFLYPPLYYMVAAVFAKILGSGFLPLRLLSLVSSLGVFVLIYRFVRRETGSTFPGVLAAGLFAATYDKVGGWFDLARLDSFYLLLLVAGIYVLRFKKSATGAAAAGLLMGAAFLTKQSALVITIPLGIHCLITDIKRAPWFIGAAGIVMWGGAMIIDRVSDGWFHYYCAYLPARHPRVEGAVLGFWTKDLLPALPIAGIASVGYAAGRFLSGESRERLFFPLLAVGMIGSSWSVRNMVGAEVNNLLPAFMAVAMFTALGVHGVRSLAAREGEGRWPRIALVAEVLFGAQLALLAYNPAKHIPTAADRAAGTKLVERIAAVDGEVFIPHHGYLAILAGKRSFAHTLALDNVHVEDDGPARRDLELEIVRAVTEKRFAAVLLESDGWHEMDFLRTYAVRESLFDRPDVFWPVTGARLRPKALCTPR